MGGKSRSQILTYRVSFFGGFPEMFFSPELNHNHHLLSQTGLQLQCCVRWLLHVPQQFVPQCLLVQLQSHTELSSFTLARTLTSQCMMSAKKCKIGVLIKQLTFVESKSNFHDFKLIFIEFPESTVITDMGEKVQLRPRKTLLFCVCTKFQEVSCGQH